MSYEENSEYQSLSQPLEDLQYKFGDIFDYESPTKSGFIDKQFSLDNPEHPSADPQRFIRMGAADAINRVAGTNPQAITLIDLEKIHTSLFDRSAAVRLAIAQALGRIARVDSIPHLERLIAAEDESDMVRKAAAESLSRCTAMTNDQNAEPVIAPHPSDSIEQQQAENLVLAWLNDELNLNLVHHADTLSSGVKIQIDGYDPAAKVVCEIYSRVSQLKPAHRHKIAADILKLAWFERQLGEPLNHKIICFASQEAANCLANASWLAAAAKEFGVTFRVAILEENIITGLRAAEKRQYR